MRYADDFVLGFNGPKAEARQVRESLETFLRDSLKCELCGSTVDVEVHHICALRDLNVKGRREKPRWVKLMATRKRKTLVACRTCHMDIHHGRSHPQKQTQTTGEPDAVKAARPVRGRADGKALH